MICCLYEKFLKKETIEFMWLQAVNAIDWAFIEFSTVQLGKFTS